MSSDKKRDDKYFNCDEEYEFTYVASLYKEYDDVYNYLKDKCKDGTIKYNTHKEVYKMLEDAGYTKK